MTTVADLLASTEVLLRQTRSDERGVPLTRYERSARQLASFVSNLLVEEHVINLREDGWTIQHPLSCRLDGTLFDCPVNRAAAAKYEDDYPDDLGRFHCRVTDGDFLLGEPVDG